MTFAPYERHDCVLIIRAMLKCRCSDMAWTRREPFIRAFRVLFKTCRLNSKASYGGRVLLFLVYTSGRVHSKKTCIFRLFQSEAFIHHHHHVPVSEGFNSHHDFVKPLFHSSLLYRLKHNLGLACPRRTGYLSSKLILFPNSDSTSQLMRLTTSGDISLNPGLERCSFCGNSVAWNHRSPSCAPANVGATSSAAKSHQGRLVVTLAWTLAQKDALFIVIPSLETIVPILRLPANVGAT